MTVVRTIVAELFGLFVDDMMFAAAVLIWVVLVGLAVHMIGDSASWLSLLLVVGLVAILIESAVRRARSS